MRLACLLLAVLALTACATAKTTYTADGRQGHSINCSGGALNWGACYEKAGELCGERGYDILQRSGDQQVSIAGTQIGLFGSANQTRSLLVACKQ